MQVLQFILNFIFSFKKAQTTEGVLLFSVQLFLVVVDVKMTVLFCGEQKSEISNDTIMLYSLNQLSMINISKVFALKFFAYLE